MFWRESKNGNVSLRDLLTWTEYQYLEYVVPVMMSTDPHLFLLVCCCCLLLTSSSSSVHAVNEQWAKRRENSAFQFKIADSKIECESRTFFSINIYFLVLISIVKFVILVGNKLATYGRCRHTHNAASSTCWSWINSISFLTKMMLARPLLTSLFTWRVLTL